MAYSVAIYNGDLEVEAIFGDFASESEAQAFGDKTAKQMEEIRGDWLYGQITCEVFFKDESPEAQLEKLLSKERAKYTDRKNHLGGTIAKI